MQKCLHSKKKNSLSAVKNVLMVFLVSVAFLILLTDNADNGGYSRNPQQPLYLSLMGEMLSSKNENPENGVRLQNVKMNNLQQKNAKIYNCTTNEKLRAVSDAEYVNVLMKDGSVCRMELEEYVKGCVFGEMPLDFELQALMAQSVAVRSFTLRRMLYGTTKHPSAPVCTDFNCCQCYVFPSAESIPRQKMQKLETAVRVTRGIVAKYDGQPIEAAYHASSGECTLDSEDVWGGRVEYLRSVKAPEGETDIYANGYGHRVGLSQHGANLLAKQGFSYAEIIMYYYTGVSLGFM